jgi:transcription initiation factor TFIIE subunit alpha
MGYACPSCGKTFEVLQVHDIVDPATGLLYCDQCGSEVVSYDPSQHASANGTSNADKMQHFNTSMRGIRDALKLIEDIAIPNFNINVWIARNVKTIPLPGEEGTSEADKTRYKVVIGDEGDEKERIERDRLAEAQR